MSNIQVDSSPEPAVVEFDDLQKANVAAALQALADQITPAEIKPQPTESDEVIELLSDSEAGNESDCEIMGFLIENNSGDCHVQKEFNLSMIKPIMVKQEIKEEIAELEPEIQRHDTGAFVISDIGDSGQKSVTWKETSFVNDVNISHENTTNFVTDETESNTSESRLEIVDEPHSLDNDNISLQQTSDISSRTNVLVESVVTLNTPNVLQSSNQVHNLPTYATLTDITKDELHVEEVNMQNLTAPLPVVVDSEETLSADSEVLSNFCKKEPNVFKTDAMEMNDDSAAERFVIDLLDDDDNDPDYICNSDEESDNDEETKKIVIDLLESDDENEQIGTSSSSYIRACREGFANLIHFICPQCGENCGKYSNYLIHTEGVHALDTIAALNLRTIIDKVGKLCYQCIECDAKLRLKSPYTKLLAHRIKHLPHCNYLKCRLCDMKYNNKSSLRCHLKTVHAKITRQYIRKSGGSERILKFIKIKCPICQRVQPNHKKWWNHLEETHDYVDVMKSQTTELGDDIYSCKLCKDKNVERKIRKRSIRDHMLTHEKHKSFKCTGCNEFSSCCISRVFTHVRYEHLNEKPSHPCIYCDEVFETTRRRYIHYRDHHKCTIKTCVVCEKEFFSTALLVTHMNLYSHYKLK